MTAPDGAAEPTWAAALLTRLDDVATMACHGVPDCDAAAISVVLPTGAAPAVATTGLARDVVVAQHESGDGPSLRALRDGVVVRVDDLSADARWPAVAHAARAAGLRSALSVPLRADGRVVGVLDLHGRRPGGFDAWSVAVAGVLARQAAGAVHDEEVVRRSGVADAQHARISKALQRHLLPVLPVLPGIVSAARYLAAERSAEVGGDWYDVFRLPDGTIGLAVGDVVGHDIVAAAAMGQLRSVLRSYAYDGVAPPEVLDRLDRLAQGFEMALATAVYGTLALQPGGACLTFCNAGHVPPLLRLPDGRVQLLEDGASWLIGVPSSLGPRTGAEIWLPSGSELVLYTDGLVERHRQHLDEGIDRLRALLSGAPVGTTPDALCDRLVAAMADGGYVDDLALLVVQVV